MEDRNKENKSKSKLIPEDLKEFYMNNLTVFVGSTDIPKEFSNMGEGFKSERYLFEDDLNKLSDETFLYIAKKKRPDFIIKNFKSGGVGSF